ncbi:MAG TPA: hypothetical protein VEI02_04720 [Planctomycetota bacterium]|nr:hypothetical protein [Planctomycetota bacterium]
MRRLAAFLVCAVMLAVVAAAMRPTLSAPPDAARVARTVEALARLRTAVERHHADVGRYPREYPHHPAATRELTAPQPTAGWRGPYLEAPFRHADCPIGARWFLHADAALPRLEGFDLDGDGAVEPRTTASVLRIEYAEERWAEALDKVVDAGVPGAWRTTGRLRFANERAGKPGTADVLLHP